MLEVIPAVLRIVRVVGRQALQGGKRARGHSRAQLVAICQGQLRGQVGQRIEDKRAGVQVIVRYLQAWFVNHALAEQQYIEVERAGSPALCLAHPARCRPS